jgi:thiamine kinase-like enzyme
MDRSETAAVEAALARVPGFAGHPLRVTAVPGGLINRTYRVDSAAGSAAVRLAVDGEPLVVDRAAECASARAAAAIGIGPEVLLCDPVTGVSVTAWLPGRTLDRSDLDDAEMLGRVAALCRSLHAGPRHGAELDIFAVRRHYRRIVEERGLAIPAGYDDLEPATDTVESALRAAPEPTVPCHNDLRAANIVVDDERMWLLDYEYAANNEPCFELGTLWSDSALPLDRLDELVAAYYGRPRPSQVARARLFAAVANYTWSLWASISADSAGMGFDLRSWALQAFERSAAVLRSAALPRLVTEANR